MVEREFHKLLDQIQMRECEEQTTEVKSAHGGCPEKLYDTISAFSNQNSGGVLVFGLDERDHFKKVGVYDAQDLQKRIMEYCEQMTPAVRPVFTVCDEDDMVFVAAEIPPVDIADRPCFKTAKGRLAGSYIRVGDADKPMREYEVYSYEAYRRRTRDDIRPLNGILETALDQSKVEDYLLVKRTRRPNLALLPLEQQKELAGITRNGMVTMAALQLFGIYPQAYYPQLCILASRVPGTEMGAVDANGNRFLDSKRIEGTLPDILDEAIQFVKSNMHVATRIDPKTGMREDVPQYPMDAVREALLNALVHRDYSVYTENMPIQLVMYSDRLVITNQGGLYGRMTIDQLGNVQPDTRNPALVTAMETLKQTENRYSGIPTIRAAMKRMMLPEPMFSDSRGEFSVTLFNRPESTIRPNEEQQQARQTIADEKGLLIFCRIPRTRTEIIQHIGIASAQYALRHYLDPLIQAGLIRLTIPDKRRSPNQQYVTVDTGCERNQEE